MGHLYSTTDLKELHDFAVKKLNLKPEWNHLGTWFPHFDLTTKAKKDKCLSYGVKLVDARELETYKQCKEWFIQLYKEEQIKDNKFWYESKGLYGQRINRLDFEKLKHRLE